MGIKDYILNNFKNDDKESIKEAITEIRKRKRR